MAFTPISSIPTTASLELLVDDLNVTADAIAATLGDISATAQGEATMIAILTGTVTGSDVADILVSGL